MPRPCRHGTQSAPSEQRRRCPARALRLLFVIAAGRGGSLVPLMCVDQSQDALGSFGLLGWEAALAGWLAGSPWQVDFIAGLADPAESAGIEQALTLMVERLRGGRSEGLLALGREGAPLSFRRHHGLR